MEFRNIDALVLLCKAARVARLIPATRVVEISSHIDFYWYIQRLNPFWYYERILEQRKATKKVEQNLEPKRGSPLVRRASWGGLEISALAKVKALADERRKLEEQRGFASRMVERMKRTLRSVGLLPNTNVDLKRHIAATKIQRAWRTHMSRQHDFRSVDGLDTMSIEDEGWKGRATSGSALERVLKKRSMLGSYHRQNGKNIRSINERPENVRPTNSLTKNEHNGTRADSQVGTAMAEVTGQWVATITLFSLILTVLFSYHERDATRPATMVVLHGQVTQGSDPSLAERAINTSVQSVIPDLLDYKLWEPDLNDVSLNFFFEPEREVGLRDREKLKIIVKDSWGTSEGTFENRNEKRAEAMLELLVTIFVLLVWFLGVTAFAGPVMTLVIIPIERMVRLLGMLMVDPLGYQTNLRFKKFKFEEDALIKKSMWTKEVLKGMETSFLMSTILRIGNLMKVGFGSAGVEIIRHNLQKGQNKNMLILNSQGSTVACIFLFCDVRQFTDATECLQEEVFVFTNRIAGVVHSICHSYGGSANKNVGDAFLVSWLLEDESGGGRFTARSSQALVAKHNQADKALLSVVKICIALHYDDYYVQTMSEVARTALLKKLKNRPGPVVQMGFGLHAGKAVQGAIGSQRKIDATYVSEAVERAEYLESSTKQYGLKMLMSDSFHRLLHSSNRRRCRKIDQIMFMSDDAEEEPSFDQGDVMELFTYDMDIDALWRHKKTSKVADGIDTTSSDGEGPRHSGSTSGRSAQKQRARRMSMRGYGPKRDSGSDDLSKAGSISTSDTGLGMMTAANIASEFAGSMYLDVDMNEDTADPGELVLPSEPALYTANVWLQEDMRRIRHQYTSVVFQTFNSGLQRYYDKDWIGARQCFEAILERFEDGPSRYFLNQMEKHSWTPPPSFQGFGKAYR